jgi:RNA polymerase sigma factor (sigma-70 family)
MLSRVSTEDILLGRAARGDSAAFASLVRRHQSPLRGFLLRLTRGDHALADDLAQEVFIDAYRKLAQYDGRGSFAGWLYAIAWSRFRMAVRKRRPEALGEEDIPDTAAPAAGGSEARLDLEKAMAQLAPGERASLTLCFALGMSHEEAAMALNLPLGTLKSHVARGREKLKTLLAAWERET